MRSVSSEAHLAVALSGLLLVLVGEIERDKPWSTWLAPIGLACVVLALISSLRAVTRAGRQRIAVVGILAGGAAVSDAQVVVAEVGGAVVLAGSITVAWHHRRPRRRAQVADYRVTDAMLRERFAALVEGPARERWHAFLALREPGDELWCVHEPPSDPAERGTAEFCVLVRPDASAGAGDVSAEGESSPGSPAWNGREIARFPIRAD
jgi:hypothetical protein